MAGSAPKVQGSQLKSAVVSGQPKEGRRERGKREKLSRIVAAARSLFRVKGFAETTTAEITEAADVGSGTLFLYAKSKEDLLVLVFKGELTEWIERVYKAIPTDISLMDRVELLFDGNIAYHARDTVTARELIREIAFLGNPDRREDVLSIMSGVVDKLEQFVVSAQQRGEVWEGVDARSAAECMFSIYFQRLQYWLGGYSDYEEFRVDLRRLIKVVIEGVCLRTQNSEV